MLEQINVSFKHSAWCGKAGWYEESTLDTLNKITQAFEGKIQPIIILTNASKESRSGKVTISKHRVTGHFCDAWDDMEDIYINLGMDSDCLSLSDMIPVSALLCQPGVEIDFAIQTTDLTTMFDLVDNEEEKLITLSEDKWQKLEDYCETIKTGSSTWDEDSIQFPRVIDEVWLLCVKAWI